MRAHRVFINARNRNHCENLAKDRYPTYVVTKIKRDTKNPPKRVMRMGRKKRFRVWIKPRER